MIAPKFLSKAGARLAFTKKNLTFYVIFTPVTPIQLFYLLTLTFPNMSESPGLKKNQQKTESWPLISTHTSHRWRRIEIEMMKYGYHNDTSKIKV